MNKSKFTICAICLVLANINLANASTDILNNILNQTNNYITEMSNVTKKYAEITAKYASLKIDYDISDVLAKFDKLEKIKEKAESLKERAEKLQRIYQQAVEIGQKVSAKYEAIKAEADALYAQAQEAYAEYEALKEEYTSMYKSIDEAIFPNKPQEENIVEAEDPETSIPEAKTDDSDSLAEFSADLAKAKDTMSLEKSLPETDDSLSAPTPRSIENIKADVVANPAPEPAIVETEIISKADTIVQAGSLAEQTVPELPYEPEISIQTELPKAKEVSVDDVLKAKSMPIKQYSKLPVAQAQFSPLNIEQQLHQATTQTKTFKSTKPIILDKKIEAKEISRQQFAPAAIQTIKENANEK